MSDTVKKVAKPTKRDYYEIVKAVLFAAEKNGLTIKESSYEELQTFLDKEIAAIDKKTASAKERAAAKKAEGDDLREKVYNAMSETEFMTREDIKAAVGDPDVSVAMVTSRLAQLYKLNLVEKEKAKVESTIEGGKPREATVYRKIAE